MLALQMCCPAANLVVANAAFENIGLGPEHFSIQLCPADAADMTVATHYGSHWASVPAAIAQVVENMVSGVVPTSYINEYDQPATAQWGVNGIPTEAQVITAMAGVTFRRKPYDSPEDYNALEQWAGFLAIDNLVNVIVPEPN